MSDTPGPGTTISAPVESVSHCRSQAFPTAKALELRFKGNTYEEIGLILRPEQPYHPQNVYKHLKKFNSLISDPAALDGYQAQRGQVLSALEFRLLDSLADETAIQNASLRDRTIAFGTVYDKRRLESGQSTANLSVLSRVIEGADAKLFENQVAKKQAKQRMDSGD